MLTAIAITAGIAVTAVVLLILHLMGRPCLVCDKPVIDCLCPLLPEEADAPDAPDMPAPAPDTDFTRTCLAGYVDAIDYGPAPVYPRHPEIPKGGA